MNLTDLEQQYRFTYPALYKRLERDGMLDVGQYGPQWRDTVLPRLKQRPTLLLHSADFELLNVDAVATELAALKDPDDYRNIKPEYTFIPFGQSGSGDLYCLLLTGNANGEQMPVVLLAHDLNEATYLAKNLSDYIFRTLLTDLSEQDTYNGQRDEEFRDNLTRVFQTHLQYLSEAQAATLQEKLAGNIIDYDVALRKGRTEKRRGLLTNTKRDALLQQLIPFDNMGRTFEYSAD